MPALLFTACSVTDPTCHAACPALPARRLVNLELLLKFGPDSWRMHNEVLASFVARLQEQLAGVRRQVDDLNRERKLQQHAAGGELGKLEAEYLSLVHKNAEIEAACRGLEAEVAAMRQALPRGADGEPLAQQQGKDGDAAGGGQENGVAAAAAEPAEGMQE
jgi:pre-mRNA-splicing factor SPF27